VAPTHRNVGSKWHGLLKYKVEDWHARLGGGILADSIMDRIIHNAVRVFSGNLNMRELHAQQGVRVAELTN